MPEQPLFLLVSVGDDYLWGHWTFRAADELAVMRHLLRHHWDYERIFRKLRISHREVDQVSPEKLLLAINNSYAAQRAPAVFYLIRVAPNDICQVVEAAAGAETTPRSPD